MAQCKSGDISCPCSSYEKLFPSYLVLSHLISRVYIHLHHYSLPRRCFRFTKVWSSSSRSSSLSCRGSSNHRCGSISIDFDQFRSVSIRLHGCDRLRPPSPLQCQSERNPRTAWRQQGTRSDGRAVWLAQGSRRLTVRSLSPSTCFSQTQSCGEEPKGLKKLSKRFQQAAFGCFHSRACRRCRFCSPLSCHFCLLTSPGPTNTSVLFFDL